MDLWFLQFIKQNNQLTHLKSNVEQQLWKTDFLTAVNTCVHLSFSSSSDKTKYKQFKCRYVYRD